MKTLRLETTAPFQGLAELVADREGLFEAEGVRIEWVGRVNTPREIDTSETSPDAFSAFGSHGNTFEQGGADMYNACEWGNYRRVQDSAARGRQVGRRSIVTCAAIVVRPDSDVFTPQQLAGRTIGVPYFFGTHYLTMHLLEGFMPRDRIETCRAPNGSAARYDAMFSGEIEATTLTEPYITLAEKKGCRVVCEALYHGTEVVADTVDAETYAAFNRAVSKAVRLIDADKRKYAQIFLDYHEGQHPGLADLTVDDLRLSRIQVTDPAPIPEHELQRTYEWMRSWNMLDDVGEQTLIDADRQAQAHDLLGA